MKSFNHSYVRGLATGALVIIALVALFTLLRRDSSAQRPVAVNPVNPVNFGRYQLINGVYSAAMGGKDVEYRDLFRIDTETGVTWIYEAQATKDGYINVWVRVADLQTR